MSKNISEKELCKWNGKVEHHSLRCEAKYRNGLQYRFYRSGAVLEARLEKVTLTEY